MTAINYPGHQHYVDPYHRPETYDLLTPKQVAEMAAAGVKIEFKDIEHRLVTHDMDQPAPYIEPIESDKNLLNLLYDRLLRGRAPQDQGMFMRHPSAFSFVAAHKLNDEKVAIFVAIKGEALTIYDDWAIYPSDALITQFRLLEST